MTSGFWPRVRARALRAPVFLGLIATANGALRAPPAHRSFAAPLKIKIDYFQKQNVFLQARTRAVRSKAVNREAKRSRR